MRRAALVVATLTVAGSMLLASTAQASKFIQPGILDDAQILYGNPDKVFPILQQMNTKLVRVNLWWGGPALTVASRRPANPTNPNDPAYDWATYDRTVTYAAKFGMKVVLSILGTPRWANGARGWNVAPTNASDLRSFAVAAARRYSGLHAGPDGTPLPRVPYWLVWNEPNNPVFLRPQYAKVRGSWQIVSGRAYAQMCNAVVQGVHSVSRDLKVGCGVTGPRGNNNPNSPRPSVSPLPFLRAMHAGGARGYDAYAHHPYYGSVKETPATPPPPPPRGQPATAVTLGNFQLLTRELARLRIRARIWVTEYGYQTNPPDRVLGVSWADQATYMKQAYAKLKANPRVDMFIWFLLRDETRLNGWQSGLYTASGARKDAREAFEGLAKKK
ncbi:glycosyl hydrolase [Gaiella occulta]|uniref:glycosyl hydrolase n=1 Tax=Gaiella occulta TaxID=1002870 RepID=UPI000E0AA7CF|nr:glycosyl hydrolase [Gaiella occulta]